MRMGSPRAQATQARRRSSSATSAGKGSAAALRSDCDALCARLRLRSTFPLADRRPKPECPHPSALTNSQPAIHQIRIPQSLLELVSGHSANMSHSAMKPRFIVWRRRARQGYYGSVRLGAPASVPPCTRPPPPGVFAFRFSSREAVAVTTSENESQPLSGANNSARSYLPHIFPSEWLRCQHTSA